jgi:hypothetical protein
MTSIDGSSPSERDPVASACFRLGWRVEELFSQFAVPERPPRAYDLPRLPGLSKLTSYDWQRLGLDQVDFVVGQVTAKVGAPAAIRLDITAAARGKLDATISGDPGGPGALGAPGAAARRDDYRAALTDLHVNLLVLLTAADSSYGKAYGLGRALADTTCPNQSPEQLAASFERGRIGRIYVWLDELASLLPEHAARAVAQSLEWWQQAVAATASGSTLRPYFTEQADGRPAWKQAAAALMPRRQQESSVQPPAMENLAAAIARQGALWRGILDGDKMCTDLLTPQDYLRAGDRLAHHYANLAWRVLRTMPWLLALPIAFLAIVVVLAVIPGSAVARTATGVAALAGTLSGTWRAIRTRVVPVAAQLEGPLWGSELDTAAAEAVTIPPVGTPQNPMWESAFEQAADDAPVPPSGQ